MGWQLSSLTRLMSRRNSNRTGGPSSSSSSSSSPSPSGTPVRDTSPTQKQKASWKELKGCLSCDAMTPCTRSKTRALRSSQLQQSGEQEQAGEQAGPMASQKGTKRRTRPNDAEKVDVVMKRESDTGSENFNKCEICQALTGTDPFVTSCKHICCRSCLKEHFEKLIHGQMSATQSTFDDLDCKIVCPNTRCNEELTHRELVDLLGPKPVKLYERWFASASDQHYALSLRSSRSECTNSNCAESAAGPSVILASKISCLSTAEVRHALAVRGSTKKQLKQAGIRELLRVVRHGSEKGGSCLVWLCITCDASWCAACGRHLPPILTQRDRRKTHKSCRAQQRYDIYKSLVELETAAKLYTEGKRGPVEKNSTAVNVDHTIWAGGTGYGGENIEYNKGVSENTQAAARKVEIELDSQVVKQIAFLTSVLKEQNLSLTVATCAIVGWENVLSRFLQQLATNDSMLDISERRTLYLKMVSLLGAIQLHGELRPILAGCVEYQAQRRDQEAWIDQWVGLKQKTASNEARAEDADGSAVDKDNSVITKLGNIYRQAQVMLQNMPQAQGNQGVDVDMSLARDLCKCYESLHGAISKQDIALAEDHSAESARTKLKAKNVELEDTECKKEVELSAARYKETLGKWQFRQLCMADENGVYKHQFKDYIAGKVAHSTCIDKRGAHNHKRMIHLSKEIASLATTLPLEWESSIHLCVDESRLDILRALIIGPDGTPYQNGLFFFDIFLPPDYPQVPPLVHFLTTGGGKVRFNPNLYDSGKICLSLLGTWSGPGWIPGKSTLLQVLVSIQSLIFVKEPYYNEPGFEQTKSPEAEKENKRHREHTLSLAVLAPLRKPDPFFADIVREHFRFKQEEVQLQCDEWVAAVPVGYARQRISAIAIDIKKELQNLS